MRRMALTQLPEDRDALAALEVTGGAIDSLGLRYVCNSGGAQ